MNCIQHPGLIVLITVLCAGCAKKAHDKAHPAGTPPVRPAPRADLPPRPGTHLQVPAGLDEAARKRWAAEFANTPPVGAMGGPRPGLTAEQTLAFVRGRALFRDGPGIAGGLGPTYVQKACGVCHSHPEIGGEGTMKKALRLKPKPGAKDVLIVHYQAIPGHEVEPIPKGTTIGRRRAPMLFGMGLVDQLAPEVIAANADPEDRDGDGVRGRNNRRSGTLARWGLKAHDLTLRRVIIGSLYEDLGLTCNEYPHMRKDADTVADPEADESMIGDYIAFIGNLAPPPRGEITDDVKAGEKVFADTGCAACHLERVGRVRGIYSDLLLHDMGPDNGDGLADSLATSTSWRTAPLWGLRYRKQFFHDHRAKSLGQAIDLHRGEGQRSRDSAMALDATHERQFLAFLASL